MALSDFLALCQPYFAHSGAMIDQAFQPRLQEGMIRCYMAADKVVGFGHQLIKALIPPPPEGPDSLAAQPGPRIMHPALAEPFQALRIAMETEWTPQMMEALGIAAAELPIIWDADFLYGPRTAAFAVRALNRELLKLPTNRRAGSGPLAGELGMIREERGELLIELLNLFVELRELFADDLAAT